MDFAPFRKQCSIVALDAEAIEKGGGRDRVRTCDPLLAKQVLSQLSYTPTFGVNLILKHFPALRNHSFAFPSSLYQTVPNRREHKLPA